MRIHESGEMYLETILRLAGRLEHVRSVDIADEMGYSKPSVSRAVKKLQSDGLIRMDSLGAITLTDDGRTVAETIFERHEVLTKVLVNLGVSPEIAAEDACRVEHYISDETFEVIKRTLDK
ncbi:MAG: metal-dependent transcriptional regulator [Firmicutes bacterium]|nr:metal-dependent transcriptional regulator [Bacillota bacterium]